MIAHVTFYIALNPFYFWDYNNVSQITIFWRVDWCQTKNLVIHTMNIHDRITAAAANERQLYASLAEIDYAPSALQQQMEYIADLQTKLEEAEARIEMLTAKTSKERHEYEKLRDGMARRLAYKLTGQKQ